MKILYELNLNDDQKFNASDFPDKFEILRKGKDPLVFKPVSIELQTIYNRLMEAEELLHKADEFIVLCPRSMWGQGLLKNHQNYFKRYTQ